ncbi:MAG: hypothetical protein IJL69_02715, partial [Oscillospiraceae bacterium]|nr:hypothetical protein [Oscillospiraceae bacterium]
QLVEQLIRNQQVAGPSPATSSPLPRDGSVPGFFRAPRPVRGALSARNRFLMPFVCRIDAVLMLFSKICLDLPESGAIIRVQGAKKFAFFEKKRAAAPLSALPFSRARVNPTDPEAATRTTLKQQPYLPDL